MLKIKDNVDLKELEKYGFVYKPLATPKRDENGKIITYHKLKKDGTLTKKSYTKYKETFGNYIYTINDECGWYNYEYMIGKNRTIMLFLHTDIPDDNVYDLDIIYDLIKDGLVEKVE